MTTITLGFRAGQTVKAICPDNRRRYCRVERGAIEPAGGGLVSVVVLYCPGFSMFRRALEDCVPVESWRQLGDCA